MSRAPLDRSLHLALLVALVGLGAVALSGGSSPGLDVPDRPLAAVAQVVTWPPSSGLLVAEVVAGGSSASDEFVELYNAGSGDLDLGGLELVYVTASGSTVTRKQTWTQLALPAHRHLLLANSAGAWAAAADGLYSGGFASTGGSLVLRDVGGAVIDALSWGDATNQYVEGSAAPAPPAGASLERRPGGSAGNSVDSNDNSADTIVETRPVAQGLSAPPAPTASPTNSSTPSPQPSVMDSATPTTAPTVDPSSP
ncbi:MAG TPA: lamin tail domain-containing protein, partial [Candidatus Limnocylindrales bacterium]|nr:lamin tail domain-containing protein [Candidatus Limnocylindrales bacterium]